MSFVSPLRYPGGKGKLASYFSKIITANGLKGGTYIEPFAGGAGVAISLLLSDIVRKVVINDIDRPIHAFWKAVLNDNDEFVRLIEDTPLTVKEWKLQKKKQIKEDVSLLELGFSTFYLNRTNRSGILDGGPIGGLEQSGEWKINARYNTEDLVRRVKTIGQRAEAINVFNQDAEKFIQNELPNHPAESTLIYFDPPYYQKGAALYMNSYDHWDHSRLSDAITALPLHWVISYDNVPAIRDFYRHYHQHIFLLDYSAYLRRKGSEIMVFSDNLVVPDKHWLPGERTLVNENAQTIIETF